MPAVIASYEDFFARLEATGTATPEDLAGWRQLAAQDTSLFELSMRAWLRAGARPDRSFWEQLRADLDPASDVAAKLIPIVSLALLL